MGLDAPAMEDKAAGGTLMYFIIIMNIFRKPLLRMLLLTVIISCVIMVDCTEKKAALPVSSDTIASPYQVFTKSTLFSYEGKHKRWRLDSYFMKKPLADTGSMLVVPVTLWLYDTLGNIRTKVLADSGTTTGTLQNFTVWGNVYIRNQDSLIVRTQKLWLLKGTHKVMSDTFVQIETAKGDILRGKGLDAVEDFSRFSFKSQVTGQFPNFKDRMGKNEEKVF
jgi:LPS export ABC transporter protein LptC